MVLPCFKLLVQIMSIQRFPIGSAIRGMMLLASGEGGSDLKNRCIRKLDAIYCFENYFETRDIGL